MRERFRGDSCGESQPLILYVVYLQVVDGFGKVIAEHKGDDYFKR